MWFFKKVTFVIIGNNIKTAGINKWSKKEENGSQGGLVINTRQISKT